MMSHGCFELPDPPCNSNAKPKHPDSYSESRQVAEVAKDDIDNKSYHHTICRRLDQIPYQILPDRTLYDQRGLGDQVDPVEAQFPPGSMCVFVDDEHTTACGIRIDQYFDKIEHNCKTCTCTIIKSIDTCPFHVGGGVSID